MNQGLTDSIPPGLHGSISTDTQLSLLSQHGSIDWLPVEKTKLYTNAFVRRNGQVSKHGLMCYYLHVC